MEAIIKSIKLKRILNRYYFNIEVQDIEGNYYNIDKPLLSDPVSFRKQVFGIMAACNQFDLLRLGSDNPIYKEVTGYYSNGLQILEDEKGKCFLPNKKTAVYCCEDMNQSVKELFNIAVSRRLPDISVDKGKIESIRSASGVWNIFFNGDGVGTFMQTFGQIYYGFGYPINIGSTENKEGIKRASISYQSFVLSIMKFYEVNDLLELAGKVDNYPVVDITVDKNRIVNITSLETGMGFSIGKNYEIINVFEPEIAKNVK